ncbi:hypothetical protein B7463_g4685, partial [Scytalidium lignicola]
MAFSRAAAFRSVFRSARPTFARQSQGLRQAARRGYASHIPSPKTSDAPWAIGAVLVTVPTCWFLLQSAPPEAHHLHTPGGHGSSHKQEEEHVEEVKAEKSEDKAEEKVEENDETPAETADEAPSSETPSEGEEAQASEKEEPAAAEVAAGEGEQGNVAQNLENSDEEKQTPSKKAGEAKNPETNA